MGCSVAYHLTQLGWTDIVLLERRTLTSGTTWHAAGLVGQLRSTPIQIRLAKYAAELYSRLDAEGEQQTGFRRCGGLYVARTAERMTEYRRLATVARSEGVDVDIVTPSEAGRLWPLIRTSDLVGGLYLPNDGRTRPAASALALAEGARRGGARLIEDVAVTGILRRGGAAVGVVTSHGTISCESVVNCGGMWAREIGQMAGVNVPLHAAEHMYLTTEPLPGITPDLPLLRDLDGYIYMREEEGGVMLGGFGPRSKPWGMSGIAPDFAFGRLEPDPEQVQLFLDNGRVRLPALDDAVVCDVLNAPESFTPDNRYLLGEGPELRRFFVAAGLNSIGITLAPGIGQALAHWIVEGAAPMDLWEVDIRRSMPFQRSTRYLHDRTTETLGLLYAMHWPHRQPETARGVRRSPLHDRLATRGACFGVVAGFERPNWYAIDGEEPQYGYSFGRQNWFAASAAEHRAVREAVGLLDLTSFAKFLVQGEEAEVVMQRLCANDVGVPVGKVVYTAMLNSRGGIACDVTVTRLAEEKYLIVTGAAVATHDYAWIAQHLSGDSRVSLTDLSSAYAVLGVMGPRSRELLSRVTDADLSTHAFPFGSAQEITVGYAPALALRTTYVGELGWELYVPTEYATGVYDQLLTVGQAFDLRLTGYHALESLRCEKGYRSWGHDLAEDVTPLEAGLGFAVAFDKVGGFIGRDALLRQRESGIERRLIQLALEDPEPLLLGDEPIFRNGALAGRVTSGAYGHTLGRSVGLGWVAGLGTEVSQTGRSAYEIEIAGERFRAFGQRRPLYDAAGERVRA